MLTLTLRYIGPSVSGQVAEVSPVLSYRGLEDGNTYRIVGNASMVVLTMVVKMTKGIPADGIRLPARLALSGGEVIQVHPRSTAIFGGARRSEIIDDTALDASSIRRELLKGDPPVLYGHLNLFKRLEQILRNIQEPERLLLYPSTKLDEAVGLFGNAGVGKTSVIEWFSLVAVHAGLTVASYEINPQKILGSLLGQSENRLQKALKHTQEATATHALTVLQLDEAEALLRNRMLNTGGHGTETNLTTQFLHEIEGEFSLQRARRISVLRQQMEGEGVFDALKTRYGSSGQVPPDAPELQSLRDRILALGLGGTRVIFIVSNLPAMLDAAVVNRLTRFWLCRPDEEALAAMLYDLTGSGLSTITWKDCVALAQRFAPLLPVGRDIKLWAEAIAQEHSADLRFITYESLLAAEFPRGFGLERELEALAMARQAGFSDLVAQLEVEISRLHDRQYRTEDQRTQPSPQTSPTYSLSQEAFSA